jgi:hypothetical protein
VFNSVVFFCENKKKKTTRRRRVKALQTYVVAHIYHLLKKLEVRTKQLTNPPTHTPASKPSSFNINRKSINAKH